MAALLFQSGSSATVKHISSATAPLKWALLCIGTTHTNACDIAVHTVLYNKEIYLLELFCPLCSGYFVVIVLRCKGNYGLNFYLLLAVAACLKII